MKKICIAHNTVTNNTAALGNVEEQGWLNKQGMEFASNLEAIHYLREEGANNPISSHWVKGMWYSDNGTVDHSTGAITTKTYFLEGFSERIERLTFEILTK